MPRETENAGIALSALKRYLRSSGWRGRAIRSFELFEHPREAGLEVILPNDTRAPDLDESISLTLRTLSQLENREYYLIKNDIRTIGFDILRSVLPNQVVRHDSINLAVAEQFLKNMKRLLAASASTEMQPDRFFGRLKKEALQYADNCRFGHTFRGSFGFTIESPIAPNNEPSLVAADQTPPFERRVIQRLARGFQSVKAAADRDDLSAITENFERGLSANMCEGIVDLLKGTPSSKISLEFNLSSEWTPPEDMARVERFELEHNLVDLLAEAATNLRFEEMEREQTVVGRVVNLHADDNPAEILNPTGSREVTIHWGSAEWGAINVRVILPPADYLLSVEAHKSGQNLSVKGVLDRIGRRWTLSDPREIEVIS